MMKAKLAMMAILALGLTQTAGCFISSDDDDTVTVTDGVFHATWTVSDLAGPTTCEAKGADKASFLFTGSDNMGHEELFACADLVGDTDPLALDSYTYVVAMLDCPDTTPGCPGSTTLGMTDPLTTSTDTCDSISGTSCIVDLPTIDFTFSN